MKENKFRVWDKENKKWIDDSDIAINQKGLFFIRYENQVDFCPISLTKSANYILVFYTGLKDKNGKEIFEGDILKIDPESPNIQYLEVVKWITPKNWIEEKCTVNGFINHESIYKRKPEIIGNIHQNPELIKNND